MIDVNVVVIAGMSVNEAVTENDDGSYSIFINDNLCQRARMSAYKHAMRHIRNDDFREDDVQSIETRAHTKEEG